MLDVWRDTMSPRTLLNLIDHLPRTSAFQQALAQDDELAQQEALASPESSTRDIPLSEFSPEVEALAAVVDRLGEVTATLVAVNGGKPSPPRPYPRPVTAWDRARAKARHEALNDLQRQLFPDQQ